MKLSVVILFLYLFTQAAASQDSYFYKGRRIQLEARTDRIALVMNTSFIPGELRERILSDAIGAENELKQVSENLYIAEFSRSYQPDMISQITGSVNDPLIKFATPVYYGESRRVTQIPADEFIVRLRNSSSREFLYTLNAKHNVTVIGNVGNENGYLLKSNDGVKLNALELSGIYFSTGLFEFAEPNFVYPEHCLLNSIPNDQLFPLQWALMNTGQSVPTGSSLFGDLPNVNGFADSDIDAELAWNVTTGSSAVAIGVFDTGIDSTHPDFLQAGHLLPGYDAIYNRYGVPKDSGNFGGHGTCAAGLAGALANNSVGIAGVAPGCRLMSFRIFSLTGASTSAGIARAFDTARVKGVDVLSNSWNGFTPSQVVTEAIDNAALYGREGAGCIILFAAGNDGRSSPWYPAYLPNVIAVGASTNHDQKKAPGTGNHFFWGSNYGENEFGDIDVVAPSICYTTDIQGVFGYNNAGGAAGNYYSHFPGTSAACPQAAGVAALMLSVNPGLSRSDVTEKLYRGCDKIENTDYSVNKQYGKWNPYLGYGRVNAYNSVKLSEGADVVPPVIVHRNVRSHSSTYPTRISAEIIDHDGSSVPAEGVLKPKLLYRVNKNGMGWSDFDSVRADTVIQNSFEFVLPCFGYETQVQYYLKAYDNSGNEAVFPRGAPDERKMCYFSIGELVTKSRTIGPFACLDGGNTTISSEVAFESFNITDAQVQVYMQLERVSDAIIQLFSPHANSSYNRICLFASNGGGGMNLMGPVIADSAYGFWLSGIPPYSEGSYKPDYFLSTLNGMNASGNWKILHYDQFYGYTAAYDSVIINLEGTSGIASPSIRFDSEDDSVLHFPNVSYPDSAVSSVWLKNCGNSDLIIYGIAFTGDYAARFAVVSNVPGSIAPDDSAEIAVSLKSNILNSRPGVHGIRDAVENSVMEISSNDPSKPIFKISLQTEEELSEVSYLGLRVLLQGMYDAAADTTARDTITVYIRNAAPPFETVDSARAVNDSAGYAGFVLRNVSDSVNYLLEVSHRNSIVTWSSMPGQMFVNRRLEYDFTVSASSAYGDNMLMVREEPVRYAIYSGDVNRDGFVDGSDLQLIDNDANLLSTGYLPTDLNGDEFVDGTDALIAANNAAVFIGRITF